MKKAESTYMCVLCKGEFHFKDVKYSEDGKLVCVPCYNLATKIKKKKGEITAVTNKELGVNKFACRDCGYRFILKKTSRVRLICPYCGRNRIGQDFFAAEKLVSEASKGIYDCL